MGHPGRRNGLLLFDNGAQQTTSAGIALDIDFYEMDNAMRFKIYWRRFNYAAFGMFFLSVGTCAAQSTRPGTEALDFSKQKVLYMVGYAHLDTQWRWSYPQVIAEFLRKTMEDNFRLFEKYPHYVFNFTGANRYMMMKEYFPEDFQKLKQYVAAGRWFPAGSSMEEGDANMPSGEALIRQVLYGNEFFRQEFGKESTEFMLPDCFGFQASLPSILAHCGLKGFSTQKLTWGSAVGIPFNVGVWVGPDDGPNGRLSQSEPNLCTTSAIRR